MTHKAVDPPAQGGKAVDPPAQVRPTALTHTVVASTHPHVLAQESEIIITRLLEDRQLVLLHCRPQLLCFG